MSSVGTETLPIGGPGGSGEPLSAAPLTATTVPPSSTAAPDPKTAGAGFSLDVATLAKQIDDSVRLPVLLFFVSSISWLLLGSALATIASFKLNVPGFLAGIPLADLRPGASGGEQRAALRLGSSRWASVSGCGFWRGWDACRCATAAC